MHQTNQELIKKQGNKPQRKYQELLQGTPVWVQHRQNATWEPATVVNQYAPNSYWIMQENGTEQPRVYRYTRSMLKIRSTPMDGEQKAQMREWSTKTDNTEFHIPAIPYGKRNLMVKNSQGHSLPSGLVPPLPSLDLSESENFSENREESQIAEPQLCTSGTTLGNAPDAPIAPGTWSQHVRALESQPRSRVTNFTCKDTITTWISRLPVENVELLTLHLFSSVMNREQHSHIAITKEMWQILNFSFNYNSCWLLLTFDVFQGHTPSKSTTIQL